MYTHGQVDTRSAYVESFWKGEQCHEPQPSSVSPSPAHWKGKSHTQLTIPAKGTALGGGGRLTGGAVTGDTGLGEGPEVGVVAPTEVGVYAAIRCRRES